MKLSIIIPAYNTGLLLYRCVESIHVPQEWNYEIIIVDDGSTDGITPDICDNIQNSNNNVKVIHTSNNGAYEARLKGITVANGDWIMFMDSDDTMTPDGISGLIGRMNTGADIIVGTLNLNNRSVYNHKINGLLEKSKYLTALLQSKTSIGLYGKLYKRYIFEKPLIKPKERIKINEDLLMLLTAASRASTIYIDANHICYNYIFQENSMRTSMMEVSTWNYLFSLIRTILSPYILEDAIRVAFRRYRLHLIYVCMIRRGQYISITDRIYSDLLDENFWIDLNPEEQYVLKLLKSPTKQHYCHWQAKYIGNAKRYIKKFLPQ